MGNTILVVSDEHNPFFSSVYGHPFLQTPNMQTLAQEGVVFENAYCPSPLCMPTRSAFFSGRWVHDIQAYSNCNVNLKTDYPSYGAVLAEQGIHTVHVGKVHAYAPGDDLGFSEMHLPGDSPPPGDPNMCRRPLRIRTGAATRADRFGPAENPFDGDLQRMGIVLEWIESVAPRVGKPWVLSVNLSKPHFPHWVTQELWDMYAGGGGLPRYGMDCETAQHPYARDLRAHFETEQFTEEQVRGLRRGYLGCVTFVDRQLGRILQALDKTGQRETTNVVYTCDHGEMLGKFGMWWKCSLYEDSAHVPLIAAGPDFGSGVCVETPVSLMDLQASLFRIFDAERPEGWVGEPLPAGRRVSEDDPDRVVFSEYHGHGARAGAYMIRKGDWKLIYYTEGPHQLFNLARDPDELENLHERQLAKAAELEKELYRICDPEAEDRKAHEFQARQSETIAELYPDWEKQRARRQAQAQSRLKKTC